MNYKKHVISEEVDVVEDEVKEERVDVDMEEVEV